MLTFFEYLRNRAYESIVLGANEALEFLEKEKSNPAADGSELAGLPRKRKSLDFQEPDQQTDNQPQETACSGESAAEDLPAPRRRGRPRKEESSQS